MKNSYHFLVVVCSLVLLGVHCRATETTTPLPTTTTVATTEIDGESSEIVEPLNVEPKIQEAENEESDNQGPVNQEPEQEENTEPEPETEPADQETASQNRQRTNLQAEDAQKRGSRDRDRQNKEEEARDSNKSKSKSKSRSRSKSKCRSKCIQIPLKTFNGIHVKNVKLNGTNNQALNLQVFWPQHGAASHVANVSNTRGGPATGQHILAPSGIPSFPGLHLSRLRINGHNTTGLNVQMFLPPVPVHPPRQPQPTWRPTKPQQYQANQRPSQYSSDYERKNQTRYEPNSREQTSSGRPWSPNNGQNWKPAPALYRSPNYYSYEQRAPAPQYQVPAYGSRPTKHENRYAPQSGRNNVPKWQSPSPQVNGRPVNAANYYQSNPRWSSDRQNGRNDYNEPKWQSPSHQDNGRPVNAANYYESNQRWSNRDRAYDSAEPSAPRDNEMADEELGKIVAALTAADPESDEKLLRTAAQIDY